jgi:hypothetical protein
MITYGEKLTAESAAGMTLNERLWFSNLMHRYDDAIARNDTKDLSQTLTEVYLDQASIDSIIEHESQSE